MVLNFFVPLGTCTWGFRFTSGMNASWLMKASASVRMMSSTFGLYQVAAVSATEVRRRDKAVINGRAYLQARPAGVWPEPGLGIGLPLSWSQTGVRKP